MMHQVEQLRFYKCEASAFLPCTSAVEMNQLPSPRPPLHPGEAQGKEVLTNSFRKRLRNQDARVLAIHTVV